MLLSLAEERPLSVTAAAVLSAMVSSQWFCSVSAKKNERDRKMRDGPFILDSQLSSSTREPSIQLNLSPKEQKQKPQ
jgi:hypothetical protein